MKRSVKKGAVWGIALFALAGSSAFAAPNLTNVNQKGSLLVFPLIDTSEGRDTLIMLSNDNTKPIWVKCYYGEYTGYYYTKPTKDFEFKVTKNHPFYWYASSGEGSVKLPSFPDDYTGTGELKCWATTKGGADQIKWNHLSGVAKVVDGGVGQSWEYSAYGFYCRGTANNQPCGPVAGRIDLNGSVYDKCPRYIIGQIIPEGTPGWAPNENFLAVSSCYQDLSPDGYANAYVQQVDIDVWNEGEVKFTGAYDNIDSWWRIHLGENTVDNHSPVDNLAENLTWDELGTPSAHYRMESDAGIGLLGVQVQRSGAYGYSATTVHHAGTRNGTIYWNTGEDEPPEKQ
jgi:hypothetical protein